MSSMGPPPGEDRDRGPNLVAIYWAESAIAVTIVSLRIVGRTMVRKLGWDDFMMLFTLVRVLRSLNVHVIDEFLSYCS